MPRSSRAQAEVHRKEVLDAASALVRREGVGGVTVPEVMAAAGLTHGGFYRHFKSKEDLVAQACSAANAEKEREREQIRAAGPDEPAARRVFIERYLSTPHRDTPGQGCGIAALAGDVARAEPGSPLREAYLDGVHGILDDLAKFDENRSGGADRDHLVELAVLAGALMLSRATADDELSERILAAAKDFLIDG
ncbi:TetR/AcrR family transcriptional regulator [Nocardia sp. NEAU-G5]|uniref:TetR/AcrR family transcriptional regulator n=1 Tax=Nocardia albiluteola TaxID=2842303 RepID=A0ABS6B041_9NOCA|nr:TetR/AcrR family transcriptional regulator [Nocardia albiluteola]MBU3063666.1 TetR/AcrR family transcriptional regulator [Nocardia albiluteola]